MPARPLPVPSDDDGAADPRVTRVLHAHRAGQASRAEVLVTLSTGRLLVPVVAVLEQSSGSGDRRTDKASHLAAVSTTGRDGRRGQLAFTGLETLRRWDPAARPVPVATRAAAEAALADGADALVIDLAGPVVLEIDRPTLRALAAGWQPVDGDRGAVHWAVPVAPPAPSTGAEAQQRRPGWWDRLRSRGYRPARRPPQDGAAPNP